MVITLSVCPNGCRLVRNSEGGLLSHGVAKSTKMAYAPFRTQFKLLTARSARNAWRNKLILKVRQSSPYP